MKTMTLKKGTREDQIVCRENHGVGRQKSQEGARGRNGVTEYHPSVDGQSVRKERQTIQRRDGEGGDSNSEECLSRGTKQTQKKVTGVRSNGLKHDEDRGVKGRSGKKNLRCTKAGKKRERGHNKIPSKIRKKKKKVRQKKGGPWKLNP